jgi:hypothetical protein
VESDRSSPGALNEYRSELQAVGLIVGIAIVAAFFAVIASANVGPSLSQPPTAVPTLVALSPTAVPSVVPGPLDGLPTARPIAARRPLAVVLDNFYPDARPQTGLAKASIVFDTLTEGGITRLMALFLEHDPSRIGPIRSARPYFVAWAAGFRSLFVHAGGAPAAQQLLHRTASLADVDALAQSAGFSRASDRATPHDLYGSAKAARKLAGQTGGVLASTSPDFVFGRAARLRSRGRTRSIQITFSTPQVASPPEYAVTYRYARRRNVYLRLQGGLPFVDRATEAQIAASNVVVLTTRVGLIPNDPVGRVSVAAVGAGSAILFQNGHVVKGKWAKTSTNDPLVLTRSDGGPLTLVPGQTWIEVIPPGDVSSTGSS